MNVTVVKVIAALALGLCAAPLVAGAQQAGAVQIGYLSIGHLSPLLQVFEQALRERGWVTGKNIGLYNEPQGAFLPSIVY